MPFKNASYFGRHEEHNINVTWGSSEDCKAKVALSISGCVSSQGINGADQSYFSIGFLVT